MQSASLAGKKKEKQKFNWDVFVHRHLPFYIFLLPAIIWYAIFCYYPMTGIIIAFKNYKFSQGIFGSAWVGFKYFQDFLSDAHFYNILRNTVTISFAKLVFCFPAPIILALMFNAVNNQIFKRVTQTVSYLPHFVSWVVVAALIQKFFSPTSGLFNDMRIAQGLEPIYYLGQRELFLPFIVLSDMWKGIGYGSIIYLAAITSIDPTLYEAAELDGANGFDKLIYITLPSIKTTIGMMFLLNIGGLFGANMEQLLLLQTPATFDISEVIDTYVLRRGLNLGQLDYGTAVSLFRSVMALILVVCANKISKKLTEVSIW